MFVLHIYDGMRTFFLFSFRVRLGFGLPFAYSLVVLGRPIEESIGRCGRPSKLGVSLTAARAPSRNGRTEDAEPTCVYRTVIALGGKGGMVSF